MVRHAEQCDCGSGEKRSRCCYSGPEAGAVEYPIFDSYDHEFHGGSCPYCICLVCISILAKISNHLELLKPDLNDPPEKFDRDTAGPRPFIHPTTVF